MEEINYPAMVGVLDIKLAMFGAELRNEGLIKPEDVKRVNEMTAAMIKYAEERGIEVAKQYNK